MATSTRRGFLRGAAGLGTASAGAADRLGGGRRAALPGGGRAAGRQLLAARADRGRGRDLPAAAARPRPRGGGAPEPARGRRLRPAAGDLRAGHRLRRGRARWRGCTRPRTGTSTGTAPSPRTGGCSSPPRTRSPTAPGGSASGTRADGYRRIGEVCVGRQRAARGAADAGRAAASRWRTAASRPTRPRGAAELNLATMRSNLAYVDVASGEVVQTLALDEGLRLNSIRHIAAGARRHAGGRAAVAGVGPRASAAPRRAPAGDATGWRSTTPSRRCSGGCATTPAASRSATTAGGRRSPGRAAG